jgi:hypothetical protein
MDGMKDLSPTDHDKPDGLSPHPSSPRVSSNVYVVQARQSFASTQRFQQRSCRIRQQQ